MSFTKEDNYKPTEIGEIPEDWEVVRLGEVTTEIKQGKILATTLIKNFGDYPVYGANGIIGYYDEFFVPENKVLITCRGSTCGNINVTLKKSFVTNNAMILYEKSEKITWGFLKYSLMEYDVINLKTGSGQPQIIKGTLINHKIPLPPLPEQKSIAFVLSTIQTAKEKTEQVIKATKELKKSMMKHLFTYGPVSLEEAEKVKLKDTEIGKMPEEWEVVELGKISEVKSGGTPSTQKKEYWINGNIPWVKSGKCQNCYIYEADGYITKEGLENSSAKMLRPNTVLVAMVGATVGKVGLLTFPACTNQNVAGIYPNDEKKLYYLYLYYMLQSRYCDFTKTESFVIANLSFIKKLLIPLPPLLTQQKIASILSAIDEKIQAEEKKKQALESLFKSMLHNLMTGKVRVKNFKLAE